VDAALDGIGERPVADLPGDRAQHAGGGIGGHVLVGDGEREDTGAESDLGLAAMPAAMTEERRLLVDDIDDKKQLADRNEGTDGGAYLRQRLQRHAEEAAELQVPLAGVETHQAGARGGGDVGGVEACETVEKKAVADAETKLAALQQVLRLRHVVDDP